MATEGHLLGATKRCEDDDDDDDTREESATTRLLREDDAADNDTSATKRKDEGDDTQDKSATAKLLREKEDVDDDTGATKRKDEDDDAEDESATAKLLREGDNVDDDARENKRDGAQSLSSRDGHLSKSDCADQAQSSVSTNGRPLPENDEPLSKNGGPQQPEDRGKMTSHWRKHDESGVTPSPRGPEEDLNSTSAGTDCHTDHQPNHPPTTPNTDDEDDSTLTSGSNDLKPDLGDDLDPAVAVTPDLEAGQSLASVRKNVGVLCASFLLLFTAFMSLSGLLTSLHPDAGVGAGSLAIIYGFMIPSSLFLPPLLVSKLGCKWTLVLSISGYVIFNLANFYPTWWLMAPASAILGVAAPALWSAKCIYLTETGLRWARRTGASPAAVIARFFGIFFMVFQSSVVWGNVVSSQVFKPAGKNESGGNGSADDVRGDVMVCGADFCPWTTLNQTALLPPQDWQLYTLCGFFVAVTLMAGVLIAVFLDPLTPSRRDVTGPRSHLRLLIVTSRHLLRNRTQLLLVPLTIYDGIQQGFLYGDLTQAYAGCALGVWKIGYVMVCLGAVDALASLLAGRLVQYIGNLPVLTAGGIIHLGVLLTLLQWRPDPRAEYQVFLVSALYGVGDAIFQTNTNAVYGTFFADNSEAAFANFRVWESVGTMLPFVNSKLLCTDVKIYVSITSLALGMLGYYGAEVHGRRSNRREKVPESYEVAIALTEDAQKC